ncbi:hypothetical protein [Capnocytophaga leadbetteri]
MSTEEKKDLKTIVDKATRKVLKVTPHYVLLEPDPSLGKYANKVLFPEKLAQANEALRIAGNPEF